MQLKGIPGPFPALLEPVIDAVPEPTRIMAVKADRATLAAACMSTENTTLSVAELAEMDDHEFRMWAMHSLLAVGTWAADREVLTPGFASGYQDNPPAAEFYRQLLARLDEAFGFAELARRRGAAAEVRAQARAARKGAAA